MQPRFVRLGGIVIPFVLAAITLSACAEVPSPISRAVGNCWQVSTGESQQFLHATNSIAEKCDDDALAYTYFVASIDAASQSEYLTKSVRQASTFADLPKELATQVLTQCEEELSSILSGATRETVRSSRLVWDFSLPSEKQWDDGARWFSCELSVVAYGSTPTRPVWVTLDDGLNTVTELARNQQFDLCIDTATNEEIPLSDTAVVTSCDQPRWKLSQQPLTIAAGEFYPGAKKAQQFADETCSKKYPNAMSVYAAPLTERIWKAQGPTVGCWVSNKANPSDPAAEAARIAAEQAAAAEEAARQAAIQRNARARYWSPADSTSQGGGEQQGTQTSPTPEPTSPTPEPTTPEPEPTVPDPEPTIPELGPTTLDPEPSPPVLVEPESFFISQVKFLQVVFHWPAPFSYGSVARANDFYRSDNA